MKEKASLRNSEAHTESAGIASAGAAGVPQALANEAGQLKRKVERGLINTGELIAFLAQLEVAAKKPVKRRDLSRAYEYLTQKTKKAPEPPILLNQ